MPGGQIWANVRLTEADLRILGRFLQRTDRDWHDFATEAVRAYLREAAVAEEAQAEGAEEEEALAHRRRLVESWGAPALGEAPEGAEANPEAEGDQDPVRGFTLLEAARRAHPR